MANNKNLIKGGRLRGNIEEASRIGKIGGTVSGQVKQRQKLITNLYFDFLSNKHKIKIGDDVKEVSGSEMVAKAVQNIIAKSNRSSVEMIKELRDATEGKLINVGFKLPDFDNENEK